MKHSICILICLCISNTIFAQTQKGTWNLGISSNVANIYAEEPNASPGFGSFGIQFAFKEDGIKTTDTRISNFNFQPSIGYFLFDGFLTRINIGITTQRVRSEGDLVSTLNFYTVGPEVRYYFGSRKIRPYVGALTTIGTGKSRDLNFEEEYFKVRFTQFRCEVGAAFFIGQNASIDLGLGFSNLRAKSGQTILGERANNIGINFGVNFFF